MTFAQPRIARAAAPVFTLLAATGWMIFVAPAVRAEPPADTGSWKLIFNEEFDGDAADIDSRWAFENGSPGHIMSSRWRENFTTENGVGRLLTKKESRGKADWTSCHMWTKQKFFYGYYEASFRYAGAPGLNNAFWIMPWNPKKTEGGHEIDINEGHYPNEVNTNIHEWYPKHHGHGKHFVREGEDLSKGFHRYGFLWTEKDLVWYYDDKEIRREPNSWCHIPGLVRLSTAVMKWAGPITDALDGASMDVQYVRVYKLEAKSSDE